MTEPRHAFVLAGGRSSRMGRSKAQLSWGGATFLEHTLGMLSRAGFTPAVAGLREPAACGFPVVADRFEDSGPLGGIEAGLRSLGEAADVSVLFMAVDLPRMPPELPRLLWDRAAATGALATVPSIGGRAQPLCAVYHSSLAKGIGEALKSGDRKVMRVMQQLAPRSFDVFRVEALAPALGWTGTHTWFANLNTPADLAHLRSGFAPETRSVNTLPRI